jgi:hypothetical protein
METDKHGNMIRWRIELDRRPEGEQETEHNVFETDSKETAKRFVDELQENPTVARVQLIRMVYRPTQEQPPRWQEPELKTVLRVDME